MTLFLASLPEESNSGGTPTSSLPTPYSQTYRINALRVAGSLTALLLAVTSAPTISPFADAVLELLGAVAIFVAIAGRAWCLFYIGGRKNAELVRQGPYSVTRNPLYLFSLIGIVGIGAISGSLLVAIAFLAASYMAFAIAIRGEEKHLADRYGLAFADYCQSVPRLIPNLALWFEDADARLRSRHAIIGLRDGVVFVAGWLVLKMFEILHQAGMLPVLLELPV